MEYIKLVNGNLVAMTDAEITARQVEELAWRNAQPLMQWQSLIAATDIKIPRAIEDIIDALDHSVRAKIAKETIDAYNAKKQIRLEKPTGE